MKPQCAQFTTNSRKTTQSDNIKRGLLQCNSPFFVLPERNFSGFRVHGFDNRKRFDADTALPQCITAVLEAAGSSFEKVVKTTCFLSDIGDFAAFNQVYGKYLTSAPARSCVAAKDLPKGALVEVEVIAVLG